MKIAFVISAKGWGGLEMNVIRLARWLSERGHDIVFFAPEDSRVAQSARDLHMVHLSFHHKKYLDVPKAFLFARLLKKRGIRHLMVFDNFDLDFVFITKSLFLRNLKVFYQQHMQMGIAKRDFVHTLRFGAIDCWISPLEVLKQEVIKNTRFAPAKISVVPLGVEIDQFYPSMYSKAEARQRMGITTQGTLLGIAGRIDPKKGQLFLVKAVHEIIKKGIAVDLLIMGEATINDPAAQGYIREIGTYIEANQLGQYIHLRPFSKEVQVFYAAIDVFVLASEAETYGMVTIEAMISGKPVIATGKGGTSEILQHGKYGWLYTYNDATDFYEKVRWLIEQPEQTAEKALLARRSAVERYSHMRECDLMEALLLEK